MISFINPGLIDPRCISTIGVSVKEGDTPIGFFGTGLKYAIAITLRLGGKIAIWRGREEFRFGKLTTEIRGELFDLVTMNGVELGYTTRLGQRWAPWQAFRELWCNAKDENGECIAGRAEPTEDSTVVWVELDTIEACQAHLGRYILESSPVHAGKHVAFHPGPSNGIFYRGILVMRADGEAFRFAPNLIDPLELTEDRTVKNHWDPTYLMACEILTCDDEAFLEDWLTSPKDTGEHETDLDWSGFIPGSQFMNVVRRLAADTSRPLNPTALAVFKKREVPPPPIETELLESEREALCEAIAFCRALQYTVDEFPIRIVESLGPLRLGMADPKTREIVLAKRTFQMGDHTLAATLLEEWAHLKHGFADNSRDFQNWLFETVIRLGAAYLHEVKKREAA